MEKIIKFGILNQNCNRAGEICYCDDGTCGDCRQFKGTEKQLRAIAAKMADTAENNPHGSFQRKVAKSILAVCDYQF